MYPLPSLHCIERQAQRYGFHPVEGMVDDGDAAARKGSRRGVRIRLCQGNKKRQMHAADQYGSLSLHLSLCRDHLKPRGRNQLGLGRSDRALTVHACIRHFWL